MPEMPGFVQVLRGSAIGYLLALACVIGLLSLRARSVDPRIKRQALIGILIFAFFGFLRIPLLFLRPTMGPGGEVEPHPAYPIVDVFSHIVFALALLYALKLLVFEFLVLGKLRLEIPRILLDVGLIVLFFILVLVILSYETDLNVTGALGTAGVLSIVVGLAMQDTLGNVFAGLALQLERPYHAGDWISFGDFEGVVTDVSWRSTQFRTRNNDLVTVPNSTISKEAFINYSAPSRISGRLVYVGVAYHHPPAEVKRVLAECCAQIPEILERPKPSIRLKSFDAYSINYEVKFWIKDFGLVPETEETYRTVVWYAFQREGIEIPFPIQVEYQHEFRHEKGEEEEERRPLAERIFERLSEVEFLAPLTDEERRRLAERTRLKSYYTNETIIRQGDDGNSFFVLDEGEVMVCVSKDGKQEEVARLHPPAFFGEMALLTGEKRSTTVMAVQPVRLLEIDHENFKAIIVSNPDLANGMSEIVAKRRVELMAKQAALDKAKEKEMVKGQILGRIREFFGFASSGSTIEA